MRDQLAQNVLQLDYAVACFNRLLWRIETASVSRCFRFRRAHRFLLAFRV
jgi:hypothetical protein